MLYPIPAYQTLDRILQTALGTYTEAQRDTIIQANNLDWPYLADGSEPTSAYASGTLTISWGGPGSLTIPAGTLALAPLAGSPTTRTYALTNAVQFVGANILTVPIQATQIGPFGNAPPQSVTSLQGFPQVTVGNPAPISGGFQVHVLKPGDLLWIPDQYVPLTAVNPADTTSYQQEIGETDLAVSAMGGFAWGDDDLQLITGGNAILQDAGSRIRTPKGSLPWAPTVGSFVLATLGQSGASLQQRLSAVSLQAVLQDPRITHAQVTVTPNAQDPTWWDVVVQTANTASAAKTISVSSILN